MVEKNNLLVFLMMVVVIGVIYVVFYNNNSIENKGIGAYEGGQTSDLDEKEEVFTDFYGLKVRVIRDKEELLKLNRFFTIFDPVARAYILMINNIEKQSYIFDLDNLNISIYHEDGSVICNNTNLKKLNAIFRIWDRGNYISKRIFDFERDAFELNSEQIDIIIYSNGTDCDVLEKYDFIKYPVLTHYTLDLSINESLVLRRGFLTNSTVYRKYV